MNEFVFGLQLFANITNTIDSTIVSGTSGADSINNESYYVTINAGSGDDTVKSYQGSFSILNGGAGNDYIEGIYETIDGGKGNDTIVSFSGYYNLIKYAAGDGDDVIVGHSSFDTLKLTNSKVSGVSVSGNDLIVKVGTSSILFKNVNDNIENKLITIQDEDDKFMHIIYDGKNTIDVIDANFNNVNNIAAHESVTTTVLSGTNNSDIIYNHALHTTVNAAYGNDTIVNLMSNSVLNAENGDDYIYDNTNNATITAGKGNDTIKLVDNTFCRTLIKYADGDGDDVIERVGIYGNNGLYNADTIYIGGLYSTIDSGEDLIIKVGSGSMTLKNGKYSLPNIVGTYESGAGVTIDNSTANILISGIAYADSIKNESVARSVTIDSGAGNDTISNYAQKVTIKSGVGNDYIFSDYNTDYSRTDAGDGNDTVSVSGGYRHSIYGGAGDDSISSGARISTIEGGLGNDIISINDPYGNLIRYANGDGNDIVTGFGDTDTLNITNGTISNVSSSGNDVIFKVGSGSIKVKDVKNIPIHIRLADGTHTMVAYNGTKFISGIYNFNENSLVSGSSSADYIHNDGQYSTVNAGAGDDTINNHASYATINAGDGNDTIFNGDGSGSTSNAFGYEGIYSQVNAGAGDDYVYSGNLNQDTYTTINGGAGNDTIESYGWCDIVFGGGGNDYVRAGNDSTIDAGDGNDTIISHWALAEPINGGAGNDYILIEESSKNFIPTIKGDSGSDVISLKSYAYDTFIQYASGDGNDTVYGFNSDDTLQITSGSYTTTKSGSDLIVKVGDGSITLKDVSSSNIKAMAGSASEVVWTVKGTTATGKIEGKTVATIKGLKSGTKASALSGYGYNIIIPKTALTTSSKITLKSDDYTLALGDGVTAADVVEAGWVINGGSATYRTENSTAGYYVATDGKSITYKKAALSKELTTIDGLSESVTASDLTIDIKNKKVTVAENALGKGMATISNKYIFALADNVTKSVTTKASWAIDNDSAQYTTAHISEGYVLSKDKKSVTYNEESGGEMVATIDGLKKGTKSSAFTVKNNIITVAKTVLSTNNIITIDSEDYTLAIGSGAKKSVTTGEGWHISGTSAIYDLEKITAGYAVFDDGKSIGYVDETDGGDTMVKLTGLKKGTKPDALSIDYYGDEGIEYFVRFKSNIVGKNGVTVNGANSEFYTYGSMKMMNAGLGARFMVDTNSTVIGGKGDDYITEYAEGKCYLNGGAGNDSIDTDWKYNTLIGGNGDDSLRARGISYVSGGNGNDVVEAFYGENTLVGGIGDDTIISASGKVGSSSKNDILKGGAGKDSFYLVSSDNATIVDYTAGVDKVYLKDSTTGASSINGKDVSVSSYSVSGRDVILHTDSGNSITIKNGANKKITVNDSTQKYSTSSSGLFVEDNFFTSDNLSSIIESDYVGGFEFNSSEKPSQENLITYVAK